MNEWCEEGGKGSRCRKKPSFGGRETREDTVTDTVIVDGVAGLRRGGVGGLSTESDRRQTGDGRDRGRVGKQTNQKDEKNKTVQEERWD